MSQTEHPLDNYIALIDEGVADAELASMAGITVTAVKKYKAQLRKLRKEAAASESSKAKTEPMTPSTTDGKSAPAETAATVTTEAPAEPEQPPAKDAIDMARSAKAQGLSNREILMRARVLAMDNPGRLVIRTAQQFGILVRNARSGKMASMPVMQSDYKDGMAVKIAQICIDFDRTDVLYFMDPSSSEYPPKHPNIV